MGSIGRIWQYGKNNFYIRTLHRRDVLFIIAAAFGGEIEFNKFSISLLKRRGEDRGFAFRYKKNIQGISRIVNAREKINGQPVVSYTVDAPLLETLLGKDEHFETGDTIRVYDSGLNIEIETRIVKKEYNPIEKIDGSVEIANKIEDITDSLLKLREAQCIKEEFITVLELVRRWICCRT